MKERINIALLGTGFMARAHSFCYRQDERVRLNTICGTTIEKASPFKGEFAFQRVSDDWREVVSSPDIDLVDITLPNFLHYEAAMEAVTHGKDFIIEKPLALTMEQAQEIVKAADKRGVKGFYAENRLFAPLFVKAREMIAGGEVGETKLFRINELGSGPGHAGWFRSKEYSGGGALIDMGIHGLCLSEWLLDSPVVSVGADAVFRGEIEDTVICNARFENGTLGQFVSSWGIQGGLDIRAEVFGGKGTLLLDQAKAANGIISYRSEPDALSHSENRPHQAAETGWSYPYVDEWNIKGHRYELRHFIDCLTEGTPCRSTIRRGLRTLSIVHAIYEAIETGNRVSVPPEGEKEEP